MNEYMQTIKKRQRYWLSLYKSLAKIDKVHNIIGLEVHKRFKDGNDNIWH